MIAGGALASVAGMLVAVYQSGGAWATFWTLCVTLIAGGLCLAIGRGILGYD